MDQQIRQLADALAQAEAQGRGIEPLTQQFPGLTIEMAYQIQLHNIQKKVAQGRKVVGKKIGLTSRAMQQLLGVDQPDYGHLLDDMVVENRGLISFSRLLQPKVEAEVAFVLKDDLMGPGITVDDVLRATDYVLPALEIVDSRIKDWKIKIEDTIADNASSGCFVLGGKPRKVDELDLVQFGMVLYQNGQVANTGVGVAALGNPAYCVAWLANKLAEFGIGLKAGEVILSGALSAAVDAHPGDVFQARLDGLGEVGVTFIP